MRICYVADAQVPSRTANSIHVMKMCQAYRRLGHRVTLIVPRWRGGTEADVDDELAFYGLTETFRIVRCPYSPRLPDLLYFGLLLPMVARRLRPDLVHTRNLAVGWGAARVFRLPSVLELHHVPEGTPRQLSLFRRVSGSRTLRSLVAITSAQADRLRDLAAPGAPLSVAPDGVDSAWLTGAPDRRDARRELGLTGETRPLAVYTGHLYRGRGIELILELARRRPDHLFLIVGGREEDVARYRNLGGGLENVRLPGFQAPSRVPLFLRAADALLMPYADRIETTGGRDTASYASPMKLFEYLAAGRPILASTLPVLQEVLEDGRNALLLPYDEPERWSEALSRLRREPELAGGLAAAARADAARYTWEARARSILEAAGWPAG